MLYYTSFLQILVPRPSSRDRTDGPTKEVLIHLPIYKPSTWGHLWWPDIAEPAETWRYFTYPKDKRKKGVGNQFRQMISQKVPEGWIPSFHSSPFLWSKWLFQPVTDLMVSVVPWLPNGLPSLLSTFSLGNSSAPRDFSGSIRGSALYHRMATLQVF